MTRRVLIAGGILLVVVVMVAVWQVRAAREPVYGGKRLSEWIANHLPYSGIQPPMGSPEWELANEAIRAIGTNGIPTLLRLMAASDRDLRMWVHEVAAQRGLIEKPYRRAERLNEEATYALQVLGTNAIAAVPGLIEIYRRPKTEYSQMSAALALGRIGRGAEAALPVLLANFNHTNNETRFYAVSAVIDIKGDPEVVVPKLVSVLEDPKMETRWNAIVGLSMYGNKAIEAVPALLKARQAAIVDGRDIELRKQVDTALWRIAPEKTERSIVVEQRTPMVVNGTTTEALDLEIDGERKTFFKVGMSGRLSRQSWTNDPRGKVRLYRVSGGGEDRREQLLGEFEVTGLPPKPEEVHAYLMCVVADGNIYMAARDVNSNALMEIRRVGAGGNDQ